MQRTVPGLLRFQPGKNEIRTFKTKITNIPARVDRNIIDICLKHCDSGQQINKNVLTLQQLLIISERRMASLDQSATDDMSTIAMDSVSSCGVSLDQAHSKFKYPLHSNPDTSVCTHNHNLKIRSGVRTNNELCRKCLVRIRCSSSPNERSHKQEAFSSGQAAGCLFRRS